MARLSWPSFYGLKARATRECVFKRTDTQYSGKSGLDVSEMPTSIGLSDTSNDYPLGSKGFFSDTFLRRRQRKACTGGRHGHLGRVSMGCKPMPPLLLKRPVYPVHPRGSKRMGGVYAGLLSFCAFSPLDTTRKKISNGVKSIIVPSNIGLSSSPKSVYVPLNNTLTFCFAFWI